MTPGTRIGPYEIVSSLGAGGMGEVYRAHDPRLNRDVAIKLLPAAFAADAERAARFAREAQTLAALNHPHIAQVYGVENTQGSPALVMELVEGETVAERLARGPIPADESIRIARQIIDALDAAHEAGIIHRDLKPANIKLRPDGTVKVLDFGLAKAMEPKAPSGALANSPTFTSPALMTNAGVVLGTAAYMSPEQARGLAVDRRADIWAFGVVLYEMLTGRDAFAGPTVTDTLAAIVSRDPDWSALPADVPRQVRSVLARCLAKEPKERLRDIADARWELTHTTREEFSTATHPRALRLVPWAIAAAAVAVAGVTWWQTRAAVPARGDQVLLNVLPPEGATIDAGRGRFSGKFRISPNGRHVAMILNTQGGRLWVRPLDSTVARHLPNTEAAVQPFWAPGSNSLGYFSQGQLLTVDLATNLVRSLARVEDPRGAAWNSDNIVLFNGGSNSGLSRVSASGGPVTPQTQLDPQRGDRRHQWPSFLPDGRRYLFTITTGDPSTTGVYLGSLDSAAATMIVRTASNAIFALGHLFYMVDRNLVAQPFDPDRAELTGDPTLVAQSVEYSGDMRHGEFSVSRDGHVAYMAGGSSDASLGWYDRAGKPLGRLDGNAHPDIAPDDLAIAADRLDPVAGTRDIWVSDLRRGTHTRLTFGPAQDWVAEWSPDGKRIVYTSDRETPGTAHLYIKDAGGAGADELLLKTDAHKHHSDWSRDGRWLAFESTAEGGRPDLWILPMTGPREPVVFLRTPFAEGQPAFAPNTRYLAYASNESGRFEVYVQPFPASGGRWQISTTSGIQPRWRGDSKELIYVASDGRITAVDVDPETPSFGVPRPLFQSKLVGDATTEHFTVTSDGQRFLLQDFEGSRATLNVLLNWAPQKPR
jgi:eukaryotic-like serine/threonine-protein kinase